jgi:hypothetical protein
VTLSRAAGIALLLACFAAPLADVQETESGARDRAAAEGGTSVIVPSPEPFTLNAYDAIHLRHLLHRVGFLQRWDGSGHPETVAVETVYAVPAGIDRDAPGGHKRRYEIRLNGEPLDWDRLYIEYGDRMMNLRALFTYRNQYPPDDLRYFIPEILPSGEQRE